MLATMAQELRSSIEYSETNPYFAFCKSLFSRFLFYKNSSSTKLALAILLSLGVVMVSACNTIAGAYSDDPYGPVVNCDSNLPMNELLQCVKDQYEMMDKIHMTPNQKDDRKWSKRYSEGKYRTSKRFYFPDTYNNIAYKEIPKFKSIKDCYNKDKCQIKNYISADFSYDDYNNKGIAVKYTDGIVPYTLRQDKVCNYEKGIEQLKYCNIIGENAIGTPTYRHFTRSYRNNNKDVIFFDDNSTNVFIGSLEFVRLSNKKTLVGVRIFEFHPKTFQDRLKEGGWSPKGENAYQRIDPVRGNIEIISEKYNASKLFPFSAFTIWDIRDDDIQTISDNFALSLDKRENPSKLYINTGNKVYEVSIPKGNEN